MRRLLPLSVVLVAALPARAEPLPGTRPLEEKGDLALLMVEGLHKYLDRETAASVERRKERWKPDFSSVEAYRKSVQPNRDRLRKIIGAVDERVPFKDLEYVGGPGVPVLVARTAAYTAWAVRWPVFPGVDGEGLLLEPSGKVVAQAVAIPDADQTPEMIVGLAPGVAKESQFARRLAENGCRVLVPTLIDRSDTFSGNPALGRLTNQPQREFVYRMAYQMGRHIIGYEVQKVLAAVDYFTREENHPPVAVLGYGEGGLIALYAAALDDRITRTIVSGYVKPREGLWREPIYRNVWALLRELGDAELMMLGMVAAGPQFSRVVEVDYAREPAVDGPPAPRMGRSGAAPGALKTPTAEEANAEFERVGKLEGNVRFPRGWTRAGEGRPFATLSGRRLSVLPERRMIDPEEVNAEAEPEKDGPAPVDLRKNFDPAARQKRQFDQLVAFTQKLMRDSEASRAKTFWAKLDTSSPEKYAASCAPFRKQLAEEIIGKLPAPTVPMNPRSRQLYDEPKWSGWEVTLDLGPDVFAYGILLLPKDLKPGEKRPVVVCQHGLEGRPQDVCNPKMRTRAYNSFGAQLADRGYIVYAPQNPYIFQDKFRSLQRKANPLGLSLFSFIVAQHERHTDWLASLPMVDADKIGFYGLSYGGKTAMRVPALLPRYCLSICSGDFNEWTWKNVSFDFRGSYIFSGEYEMPEFDLGQTIVYAEMAALIAPRPFMVERGHDDPVGVDEWVAYEYAKVRRHYSRLKLSDRTEIEFFAGGHEVHGEGTFRFLQKHLGWPRQ
jgi:dienelactone hydrolase